MKAAPDKGPSARTSAAPARPAAPAQAQAQARPTAEGTTSPTTAAGPEAAPPAELTPQQLRLLQTGAGNAAVARLVVQRQAAAAPSTAAPAPPVKQPPSASPAFQGLKSEVRAKKTAASRHAPAAAESEAAQKAAVAPPDDRQAQGKAAQAEKMNAAKPGTFDKAGFIAAVNQAIAAQAPKNLDEADHFSGSGKAEAVKGRVSGQVGQSKATSAKEIDTATKAAPDLSKAKDKPVTPLTPDAPPPVPGAPNPAGAVPARQPDAVTDFSGGPQQINQQLADAEVTEDQLAKSNEPQFTDALGAKKEGEKHSATAPGQARGAEARQLAAAKQGAAAIGAQAMTGLAAARTSTGKQVDGGKGATKSADERRRAEVTARLQKVFDGTKTDVERTLSGLDKLVDERFTAGEKAARDAFMADQKRRMNAYKDKRYSGWTGKLKWVKDKFAGLPEEANQLFQESRKLYVAQMQNVISSIADVIGTELGKAKDRIARGRAELKAEVDKLPADLKKFGQQAAKDFTEKFDGLQADVDAKSDQLVQDLAQKYTQALNAVDDEIKKLQEENKGLIAKARDAVVGVIQTIIELKNMLLGVLAKAATAVMNIIKDPIGFLGNLVTAVGAGLKAFMANIDTHLKKGLIGWLLGTMSGAGLQIPAKFDLRGILGMISSLLGLTWGAIRARIVRKGIPEQAMSAVESGVPLVAKLQGEGVAGVTEEIKEQVGDLKGNLFGKISQYLIPTVLVAGITWIVSLLNPASAFIKACKMIVDIVTFIVERGAQIVEFVNAVLDAVIAIAGGGAGGVPGLIETALAKSIPVLIGALAAILGISGIADKVKKFFTALSKPVMKAVDWIVGKIVVLGKKIWNKLKSKVRGGDDSPEGKRQRLAKGLAAARSAAQRLNGSGRFSRAALRAAFAAIRVRYGMSSLEPVVRGGSWSARGTVNPTDEISLGVEARGTEENPQETQDPSDARYLEMIRQALPAHAATFSKEAQQAWNTTLKVTEVDEKPVWDDPPVQLAGLPAEAAGLLTDQAVLKQLLGYFKEKPRRRSGKGDDPGTAADTANFYNHAFRAGGPLRERMLHTLGKAALQELKKPRDGRSTDATNQVNSMEYGVTSGSYGKFAPLPGSGSEVNKDLEATVNAKGGIIGFLRFVATESSEWNTRVLDLWAKHKPSKDYLMDLFRRADSGKHEWIPTDYIPAVLIRAMGHLSRGDKLEAARWVALHHALRSKTEHVIWAIQGVSPNGHSGALWQQYVEHGKTKYKFTLTNGQDAFHNRLREIFNQHQGSALQYVSALRAQLRDPNNPLIWNGNLDNHDPQFLGKPVAALVKTAAGIVPMTVEQLGEEQAANFDAIMVNLDEAEDAVEEVS
ncbi:HPC2 multi-domain protein [Streptomyces sp900129855]|uniref:HPC2 multi-domain protein n=1 Tax=Streptomyces sp. 900129855 TaxID=3155129 RepID=A0ABV2ZID2_9ACTN